MKIIRVLLIGCCLLSFFYSVNAYAATDIADSHFLWLVNRDNRLTEDYTPQPLMQYGGLSVHPEAGFAFARMLEAMRADGVSGLYIQSAYRTFEHQQSLFRNKKTLLLGLGYDENEAIEMTARSIAFPGASEHQTGLAIDVSLDGTLYQSFADTEAGRWINENCHLYGFIVRYAAEKTEQTRIIYEPWHLRYVGQPHALFIKENNLCYEEYIDYLHANGMYVYWDEGGVYYLVKYTTDPEPALLRNVIDISTDKPGESAGYIITMRKTYPSLESVNQ